MLLFQFLKYLSMLILAVFFNIFLFKVFGLDMWARMFPSAIFCILYGLCIEKLSKVS